MPEATVNGQDVTFNISNVALARSQRLLESWLPPASESDLKNAKTEAEIEAEEAEMFKAMPDLLGMGGALPENVGEGDFRRHEISSNDKLRKQLLGNDYKKLGLRSTDKDGKAVPVAMASKPKPVPIKRGLQEESEDEGRSGLGRSRKQRPSEASSKPLDKTGSASDSQNEQPKSNKRPTSYLDEVLQQKASKKKRKKNKAKSQ